MAKHATIRLLVLSFVLASGAAHAGLFSRKAKPAPPPPPEPVVFVAPLPPPPPPPPIPLEFSGVQTDAPLPALMDRLQSASPDVLATVQWIGASKDNAGLPFVVVDKTNARVYAFTPAAQLKATAPVLLGVGVGDVVVISPDVPMSMIPPQKRITPAGRYPSRLVADKHGQVLLIDGPNLITMHSVAKGTPAQRRAERLASVDADDNRISFGCINVPPAFFSSILQPDFTPAMGIVYILPEKMTAAQRFGFQPTPAAVTAPMTAVAAVQVPGTATVVAATQVPGAAAAVQVSLQAPQAPAASSVDVTAAGAPAVAQ